MHDSRSLDQGSKKRPVDRLKYLKVMDRQIKCYGSRLNVLSRLDNPSPKIAIFQRLTSQTKHDDLNLHTRVADCEEEYNGIEIVKNGVYGYHFAMHTSRFRVFWIALFFL